MYRLSPPNITVPTAVTGPEADKDAANRPPDKEAEAAVTAPAVTAPVDKDATVAAPEAVRTVAVTGPVLDKPVTWARPEVNEPVDMLDDVSGPTDAEVADNEEVVMAPEAETEAARTRPVTDNAFACKPPITVVVLVTSPPRIIPYALVPMRTLPYEAPVPASRTRSPPELSA